MSDEGRSSEVGGSGGERSSPEVGSEGNRDSADNVRFEGEAVSFISSFFSLPPTPPLPSVP